MKANNYSLRHGCKHRESQRQLCPSQTHTHTHTHKQRPWVCVRSSIIQQCLCNVHRLHRHISHVVCVCVCVCNTSDIAWGSVFSRGPQSQSELGPNEQTRRLTNYWWHVSSRLISWLLHVKWLWFCCSEVTGQIRRSTKTELTASTVNALIIRRIQQDRKSVV